jgi:hypothetical protein
VRSFRWTWIVLVVSANLALAAAAHAQPKDDWAAPTVVPAPGTPAAGPPPVPPAPYDGRAAAPPDQSGAYPPPQLRQPMAGPPSGPVVHLISDNPAARLQVLTRLKWQNVCVAPCGLVVDPRATYRIGGGTVRPSDEFGMPRAAGPVSVSTQVGSNVKHWVGLGLVLSGIGTVAAGAIVYSASSNQTDAFGNTTGNVNHTVGVTYIVIGALMALIGLPLSLSHTTVDVR